MKIDNETINYLRVIACEMINKANSGHSGVALGAAPIFYALFKDHLMFDPTDCNFLNRDRFVVSAGHSSAIYYATMNLFGMGLSQIDLMDFRHLGSKTPGHPEILSTKFVEASTGPLGQGIANAVGMAIGESILEKKFNISCYNIFNNYTYCFCGDGCLMEGVAQEALSLAGTLQLNKLIILYDANNTTVDGNLDITNTENVKKKYRAMHFNVLEVKDGNDYKSITKSIAKAKKSNKPSIIVIHTIIGYGSEYSNKNIIHGKPLTNDELLRLKENLNVDTNFTFSDAIKELANKTKIRNKEFVKKWKEMFTLYKQISPKLFDELELFFKKPKQELSTILKKQVLKQDISTRDYNEILMLEQSKTYPAFIGGNADLVASTKCYIKEGDYSYKNRTGKNIRYGVREHSMGAISNGLALYLDSHIYCSTFMAFSNYMLPAIRMSALMNLPVVYMFSHDNYFAGQNGPTHQSIEQIGTLRQIPNLNVFRPCSSSELIACYDVIFKSHNPSVLCLNKQSLNIPVGEIDDAKKGAYILHGNRKDNVVVIFATGTEVELALKVCEKLAKEKISCAVVSCPCLEIFMKQKEDYKKQILNCGQIKVSIESSNDYIWYKLIGENGIRIAVEDFGKSGTKEELDEYFNFNIKSILNKIKKILNK